MKAGTMRYLESIQEHGRLQQFVAVILGTLSAVSDGMQYAWPAPIIPILESQNSSIKISHSDIVWLENMYMIGGFGGIPITIYNLNRFGRKASILIGSLQSLMAWTLISFASSIEYLYVARFISGIAANVGFVSSPMYISEIADKKIRGFLGSWVFLMMLVGILILYCVAPFVSIPVSSAVGLSCIILQLVTFPFMPESPYYYVMKQNDEAARKSLQRLRATDNIDKELEEIKATIKIQESEKRQFADFLTMENSRYAIIIMTVLNFAQHFSGYSAILMNIHSILDTSTTVLSANNISIIFSAVMLVAALTASVLMDKTGRKILLTTSSVFSGISILLLAVYLVVKDAGINVESYTWVPMLSVMCYAITFKWGLGIIPIVMTGELFPTKVKAIGMTIADAMYMTGSILSIYMYQTLKDSYAIHVPFFIFAACCFMTAIFVIVVIPETKGKSFEDIQKILSGKSAAEDNMYKLSVVTSI